MQLLVFLLVYPFLWLISILPYRLFYAFSDFVFFLVYHVAGYRKNVVLNNLNLVFPNKDKEELFRIRKSFYHHMCDMFLEMVKTMALSKEKVKQRFHITNIELLQEISKKKSILVVCSHYANWEWNVSINNYIDAKGYAVYQKIGNPYFDRLVRRIRAKWNTIPITTNETPKTVLYNERKNVRSVYGMVSDQSPMVQRAHYWSEFLGIKVPVYNGAEALARKLDLAVVFLKVSKVKRGYYEAEFIPITLSGKETKENEITEQFLSLTEQQIREKPDYYLWTHRRWKHRDKVPAEFK
ncbi:lysophospholipid acyltransferase family protein [Arenibacter latericius]|uniref:lysophospholipid acyltransferase family protein n=1 Tax=Arenibacter latericius TaxID=86104 RepID=UPI000423818C|nr:lysophospholipid acyltransferase family protein [Arenibacter latericius]MDX1362975.1 lysophospholipid acyltransferase family protein [Arenibacter latericius]